MNLILRDEVLKDVMQGCVQDKRFRDNETALEHEGGKDKE